MIPIKGLTLNSELKSILPFSPSRYEGTILIENQLKKWTISKSKILDVGHGKFYLLYLLKNINESFSYTGLDIEDHISKIDGIKVKTIKRDITKFKTSKKFDIITCLWVLEHIKNDKLALKRIYSLLESNGIFILSVPSIWSWPFEFGRHGYHYYSKEKLLEITQKEGFEVFNFHSLGGLFGWLFMILYSWPRYLFLILLLPSYILLSKIGFIKQNWKKFSSIAVSKTFYRYHKNKNAVLAHNTVISNLSRIDSFAKLFPSSYLLIAKKK